MKRKTKASYLRICDIDLRSSIEDCGNSAAQAVREARELRLQMQEHFRQHNRRVFYLLNKIRLRMDRLEKRIETLKPRPPEELNKEFT